MCNADREVMAMVNRANASRQAQRALKDLDRERKLRARKSVQAQTKAKRRALGGMIVEAGSYCALAVAVLVAMTESMVVPEVAAPVAVACFVVAGIRVDRHFRK